MVEGVAYGDLLVFLDEAFETKENLLNLFKFASSEAEIL